MATQTLTSDPFQIKSDQLPGLTRPLNFKTVTTFEKDANGKIIEGSKKTILQYQATPGGVFQAAATSTEGGKAGSWKLINAANSNTPILGASAIKSLQTPNGVLNQATQGSVVTAATKAKLNPEQTKVLSDAAKNKGSETEGEGAKLTEALSEKKEAIGTRNEFPGKGGKSPLVYPTTLRYGDQDTIKFRMVKYAPKKLDQNNKDKDLSPFERRRKITDEITIGTVILPIPSGISDSNAASWSSNETGVFGSQLYNVANSFITQGGDAASKALEGASGGVQNNSNDVKTALSNMFAESASGTTNMLSRLKGAVYNTNMELLFNGPSLRPFTFIFKLSARSEREATEIRKIIRFFKQGMAPIRTQSQLFLKAPHTFQLDYLHRGKPHDYLNRFKECALQSFSVDYTPEGQYATFYDGAMVSYQITMQFQELEPIFNDDYANKEFGGDENQDTQIGY